MNNTLFKESEIPYGILAKFGLTEEMVEDLPEKVLDDILRGKRSPVLPISMTDESGETIGTYTRFQVVRAADNTVDLVFFPKMNVCNLNKYSEADKKALLDGYAIIASIEAEDGKKVQCFHQIDPGTNQILYVPTPVIGRNLEVIANQLRLSNAELVCLQKGMPVTFSDEDGLVTVGIDLTENCGLRCALGDDKKWREEMEQPFSKYNFGLNGCWMIGDDGNFRYVHEENFTEELIEERAKVVNRRSMMAMK